MARLMIFIYFYILFLVSPLTLEKQDPELHDIYVCSLGWHTGIVVPAYSMPDSIWREGHDYSDADYLEIGWGEVDYFPHDGGTLWYAIKSVFWPTPSVLHINALPQRVEDYYVNTNVVKIEVTDEQLENIIRYFIKEFELDDQGNIIPAAEGFYAHSHFYKGSSSYYFPNHSNVWAARALKRAGFDISPIWQQTTGCVLNKAEEFGVRVEEKD